MSDMVTDNTVDQSHSSVSDQPWLSASSEDRPDDPITLADRLRHAASFFRKERTEPVPGLTEDLDDAARHLRLTKRPEPAIESTERSFGASRASDTPAIRIPPAPSAPPKPRTQKTRRRRARAQRKGLNAPQFLLVLTLLVCTSMALSYMLQEQIRSWLGADEGGTDLQSEVQMSEPLRLQ